MDIMVPVIIPLKTMLVKYKFIINYAYWLIIVTLKTMLVKYKFKAILEKDKKDFFKNNAC